MGISHSELIVILTPALRGLRGHELHAVQDLIQALQPICPTVVSSVVLRESPFPPSVHLHRLFRSNEFGSIAPDHTPGKSAVARQLHRMRRQMSRQLRKLQWFAASKFPAGLPLPRHWPELQAVAEQSGCFKADHIVLPTAPASLILELRQLLLERAVDPVPQVHARLMTGNSRKVRTSLDILFGQLAAKPRLNDHLHFYVETPAMAHFLEEHYGFRPELFPYVLNLPALSDQQAPRAPGTPVVFGCLGAPREGKGFDRLPSIIRAVAKDPSFSKGETTFIVQTDGVDRGYKHSERVTRELVDAADKYGVNIELHPSPLSSQRYYELLNRIDCFLLPYVAERYAMSGSGVLFEALAHAKPFICSARLSFADYIKEGNAIEATDDAEFAAAILRFARDPAPFQAAAQVSARAYRESLSQIPLLSRLQVKSAPVSSRSGSGAASAANSGSLSALSERAEIWREPQKNLFEAI